MFEKLVAPKTEDEITKHWKYTDKVYISVICTTFNQDSYIRDAIDGFLAQITEYKFEIIIHDDVSTDGTREILKEYQQNYPSIIKLILQDTNQYSININMPFKHGMAMAEGDYIAICEGDDFWIDGSKLQKQFNLMKDNPHSSFIAHNAYIMSGKKIKIFRQIKSNFQFSALDILQYKGQFAATASYFLKKEVFNLLPSWFYTAPVGDFYIEMYSQLLGPGIYVKDKMSVYRYQSNGSWTQKTIGVVAEMTKTKSQYIFYLYKLKNDFMHLETAFNKRIANGKLSLSLVYYRANSVPEGKVVIASINQKGWFFYTIKKVSLHSNFLCEILLNLHSFLSRLKRKIKHIFT